ncbi:hypothetical protein BSZ19_06130 [Bradyrhizobium japonicum]|uniref:Transposase IS801/IS1294 domain-containing protein n=1 Tax=Bradyrhizobium japonicum TaxID=375 RepID=A0A1Y2JYF7_BRAJP|nr:hypothetical protein BSZ19_06130 [Bradyrhizobium japonicum]
MPRRTRIPRISDRRHPELLRSRIPGQACRLRSSARRHAAHQLGRLRQTAVRGPAQVLAYLGRYTHRVAIANSRLVALDEDHVTFTWKDYRQNGATKIMKLKPDELIQRIERESGASTMLAISAWESASVRRR